MPSTDALDSMGDYSNCKDKWIQGEVSSENVTEPANKGSSNIISSTVKLDSTRNYRIYTAKRIQGGTILDNAAGIQRETETYNKKTAPHGIELLIRNAPQLRINQQR